MAQCRWLEAEYLEIDKNNEEVRKVLDFMIRDQYMGKIYQCKEKIIFLRERFPLNTLKELTDAADVYDKSHGTTGSSKTNENKFVKYRNAEIQRGNQTVQDRQYTNAINQSNRRTDNNTNHDTSRNNSQGREQTHNFNSKTLNELNLIEGDWRRGNQNKCDQNKRKCKYCSRTNHSDNDCFYKPINVQSSNFPNRNTGGQNSRMQNGNHRFTDRRVGRDNGNYVQRNENVK